MFLVTTPSFDAAKQLLHRITGSLHPLAYSQRQYVVKGPSAALLTMQ
jgi:hypothetical protein